MVRRKEEREKFEMIIKFRKEDEHILVCLVCYWTNLSPIALSRELKMFRVRIKFLEK